jgi:hypothetical protein
MKHLPQEGGMPSSPETTTALSPEQLASAITDMHGHLFEAALRPLLPPLQKTTRTSSAEWVVDTGDARLVIDQQGKFDAPPTFEDLKTRDFEVRMQAGEGPSLTAAYLDVIRYDGTDVRVFDKLAYPQELQMDQPQVDAGVAVLHSFLDGEVAPSTYETNRYMGLLGADNSTIRVSEVTRQEGGEAPRIQLGLEVGPGPGGSISFSGVVAPGGDVSATFREHTPATEAAPRSFGPEIRQDAITAAHLQEVQRRVDAGVEQLAQYHEAYRAVVTEHFPLSDV